MTLILSGAKLRQQDTILLMSTIPKPFWKSPFLAVIVGRPNVGKSTIFNLLAGRRIAIEDPTPGVTRDRIMRTVSHEGRTFDIMDTGGIGIVDTQKLEDLIEL